jgi:hypothetical protein
MYKLGQTGLQSPVLLPVVYFYLDSPLCEGPKFRQSGITFDRLWQTPQKLISKLFYNYTNLSYVCSAAATLMCGRRRSASS